MLHFYRKYAALRPLQTNHRRFFIYFKAGKCSVQPVGKNTLGKIPNLIANFLKLPNPELYTGHCMRRSSASLLADAGADITTIKRHGGWKSTAVAEGYVENSVENKKNIANQILQGTSTSNTVNVNSKENVLLNNIPGVKFYKCEHVTFNYNVNK